MKKLLLVSAIILGLAACTRFDPAAIDFVPGMQDVPLIESFTIESDKSSIFDTSTGKIVEATAIGAAPEKDVKEFYSDTLPHLGWAEADDMAFLKEGEELKITTERNSKITTIHFYLSPSENIDIPENAGKKKAKKSN